MLRPIVQFVRSLSTDVRRRLAIRFIRGRGLEIGGLHNPLWLPPWAHVTYVDRLTEAELRRHYPELRPLPLVKIDVVDDGEKLARFEPGTQDFIIANHFLEHAQDPIGTIRRHLEVLRPGGILFLAVPDKRFTFDKSRSETEYAHVLRDHLDGPQWSYDEHLREFASLVMGQSGEELDATVNGFKATHYSIHFHVWSQNSLREFLDRLVVEVCLPMKIVAFVDNTRRGGENICIVRKTTG